MSAEPTERARLEALLRYEILDTPPERDFDDLAQLAAHVCGVPVALIILADERRLWFKSRVGCSTAEIAGLQGSGIPMTGPDHVLEVPDAHQDERFKDSPLMRMEGGFRFYAGAPLATSEGHHIGTFCVLDHTPRQLASAQHDALLRLAAQVMRKLELRLDIRRASQQASFQQAILRSSESAIIATSPEGTITHLNPAAEEMLGFSSAELVGRESPEIFHDRREVEERSARLSQELGRSIPPGFEVLVCKARSGGADTREWTYVHKHGHRFPVLLTVSSMRDETGRLIGFLEIARPLAGTENAAKPAGIQELAFSPLSRWAEIGIGSLCLLIFILISLGLLVSWNLKKQPLLAAAELDRIGVNLAHAHLALEKALKGDVSVSIDNHVFGRITDTTGRLHELLEGRGDLPVESDQAARKLLMDMQFKLNDWNELTKRRWMEKAIDRIDNPNRLAYDKAYADIESQRASYGQHLRAVQDRNEDRVALINLGTFGLLAANAFVIARVFLRNRKVRRHLQLQLEDLVEQGTARLSSEIEARREIEAALRSSEERYRDLFDNSSDLVQIVSAEGRFLYVNPAWLKLIETTAEEAGTLGVLDVIHPEDHEYYQKLFQRLTWGEDVGEVRIRLVSRKGRIIEAEGNVSMRLENGKPVVLRGILGDVTERNQLVKNETRRAAYNLRLQKTLVALHHSRENGLAELFASATSVVAKLLKVERVGIWIMDGGREALDCRDLFILSTGQHEQGQRMEVGHFPKYFATISKDQLIVANDALAHPDLSELVRPHLEKLDVTSALHVPLRIGDRLCGLLCCEQTSRSREWDAEEQRFTFAVGSFLLLRIEEAVRREAVEEMNLTSERLSRVLEASELGYWDWNTNTGEATFSGRWAQMLGYEARELKQDNETWVALIHPEDKPRVLGAFSDHLVGKAETYAEEHRLRTHSGDWRWILTQGRVMLRDQDGRAVLVSGIHKDIHGAKMAEAALRHSEENLSITLRSIGDAVLAVDAQHRITRMNPVAEQLTGWPESEAVNRPIERILQLINEDSGEPLSLPVGEVLTSGEIQSLPGNCMLIGRDGRQCPVSDVVSPIRDARGHITGVVVCFHDETLQRRAAKAEQKRSAYQSTLLALRDHDGAEVALFFSLTTYIMVQTMEIERVSLWLFDETHENLVCQDLFSRSTQHHEGGQGRSAAEYPRYFEAIGHSESIIADDVRNHPATREMLGNYLDPLGITSILDVPLRAGGKLLGVLFCEHVGPARQWTVDDSKFAVAVAGYVTLAMEQAERRKAEAELRDSRIQLEAALDQAHMAHWELDVASRTFTFNERFYALYGTTSEQEGGCRVTAERYARDFCHPEDAHLVEAEIAKTIASSEAGAISQVEHRTLRRDGGVRHIIVRYSGVKDAAGNLLKIQGANQDITDLKRGKQLQAARHDVLELLAQARSLPDICSALIMQVETLFPGHPASLQILDEQDRLINGASTGLPDFYVAAFEGQSYGASVSSNGAAMATGQIFVTEDIETHPNWSPHREVARRAALRACWSEPLLTTEQHVLGTFSVYSNQPGPPTEEQKKLLMEMAHLASLSIERKQAEVALLALNNDLERRVEEQTRAVRESLERYHRTLDQMLEGCQLIGFDWSYLYVNESLARQSGVSREKMLGKTMMQIHSGIEQTPLFSVLRRCMETREMFNFDNQFIRPDGSMRWFKLSVQPVKEGLFILSVDITERIQAEQALRASEIFCRSTIDALSAHVAILDEHGHIIATNHAWKEFFHQHGLRSLNILGTNYLAFCDSPKSTFTVEASRLAAGIRDVISGAKAQFLHEFPCHSAAEKRWFLCRVTRFPGDGPVRVALAHESITDIKLSQLAIQQALATLDATQDGAFIYDPDTLRFSYVNEGAIRSLGYSRGELLGMTPKDVDAQFDETAFRETLASMIKGGVSARQFTTNYRHKDGREIPVEINLQYITPPDASPRFIAMVRDITERQNNERLAQRSQRMEALGTLAGGIAHDLNNALAPILMGMDIIRTQSPNSAEMVDIVENSAHRGAEMVRQLLTFAKGTESQRLSLQSSHLFKEVRDVMVGTFPKYIQIEGKCEAQLPSVLGDPTQLHQVLINLCVNARDAMPQGGTLTLDAKRVEMDADLASTIPDAKVGTYVLLRVRDTGTGIPEAIIHRIFDPFFTTKAPDHGTGLGLSTVQGIVRSHSGCIQVSSRPGEGTTFSVYLPAEKAGAAAKPAFKTKTDLNGHGKLILFVDDEATVREVARTVLRLMNFRVVIAADGVEGLLKVSEHKAELHAIITDMNMPHMDGLGFVRALRGILPSIPVVISSGKLDEGAIKHFRDLGVVIRLDKPFTQNDLIEKLQIVMETKTEK